MQVNKVQNQYNPSFGIKISKDLIKGADNLYWSLEYNQEKFNKFYKKAKYMEKNFGFDNYTIVPKIIYDNGKKMNALYAVKDGDSVENGVLLTLKDKFRKVLENFIHLNEYKLKTKIESQNNV